MNNNERFGPVIKRLRRRMKNYVENGPTPGATTMTLSV